MLGALGLDDTAEAVYIEMLAHPNASVPELATGLGVSHADINAAIAELTRMSLLHNDSPASQPRPVSPELGLSVLLARQQAEVALRQQAIEESRAAFARLLAAHAHKQQPPGESGVEHLEGEQAILDRMRLLAEECEWEACTFLPSPEMTTAPSTRELDERVLRKGVRMRTVLLESAGSDLAVGEYAGWFIAAGGEIRTVPTLPLRMLIVDRRTAVVPVSKDDDRPLAKVITIEGVVSPLFTLFQSVWLSGVPLGMPAHRDEEGLSPRERSVLALMASGSTDDVIARRLKVSVRTVRRIAADLSARLNARSRFQAGAQAAVRGWVTADDLE